MARGCQRGGRLLGFRDMAQKTSFTIKLTPAQMAAAERILREGNYRPRRVEYAVAAA